MQRRKPKISAHKKNLFTHKMHSEVIPTIGMSSANEPRKFVLPILVYVVWFGVNVDLEPLRRRQGRC